MGIFDDMRKSGGDIGSVVELNLKEGVTEDRRTTFVPTYRGPSELTVTKHPTKSFAGYVCGFGEYEGQQLVYISFSKGGDHLGDDERRGRANIMQDAVASYSVLNWSRGVPDGSQ